MYRFVSSINPIVLKRDYLRKYNVQRLQSKFDSLMSRYHDIEEILPNDISAKKLLVGNFKYLTKVYCAFTGYLNDKSPEERRQIVEAFKNGGFNYDSYKKTIAGFLINNANGFEIHNCFYCDLVDVTTFKRANGTVVRRFKTDHVLDKGKCPLVAMSLYNFVPSCDECNTTIKGTRTIGDTEEEISKLSPTVEGYNFDGKVNFVVNVLPGRFDLLNASRHAENYEIDFKVSEPLYQKTIDLFELKQRYNNGNVKLELLKWYDKRRNYPNKKVQELADFEDIPFNEKFEEIFELDLRRSGHYQMEKARRNVMLMD